MNFLPVLLWSDLLIWLLVVTGVVSAGFCWRNPPLRAAWQRVARQRIAMSAATILLFFLSVALLDSLHYRPQLNTAPNSESNTDKKIDGQTNSAAQPIYAVEVLSVLDALAAPLRLRYEKTYSAPLAIRAYAKESIEIRETHADGSVSTRQTRDFPRLKFGGAYLGDDLEQAEDRHYQEIGGFVVSMLLSTWLLWRLLLVMPIAFILARRKKTSYQQAWRRIWRANSHDSHENTFAWDAVLHTLLVILLIMVPLISLSANYHVFGTDKIGQDVFYQILKSIRTALVIGLITTLVTLPLAIGLGILAGYFRGWIDDLIQYLYTTLSSIPSVLLIASAVLMMQLVLDTHPQWFATAAERADLRLLLLCGILGMTSWTSLCRLLRGETLKLRELEYIQAAQAFGVPNWRILLRHILPNLMHIVIIALVMEFSSLVLAEAVLSYVGIGVDPSMISFGTIINNARMELAREPMVWWSLVAAFSFMLTLVLAANLFADALRNAFDPRH